MGDIVIIGGGFAGLEAARILAKKRSRLQQRRILLVDAKSHFDFLPVLPDVVSGRVKKEHASMDLADYCETLQVNFNQDEVLKINTDANEIFLKSGNVLSYEFLILACGSVSNFCGQAELQKRALKCDTADDAMMLSNVITTYPTKNILIIGGGFTGIEVATHIAILLRRKKIKKYSLSIVEKGQDVLGFLPDWMKDYCRINLCALRINIYCDCFLKELSDRRLKLSNGLEFENHLLVWAAGVSTPSFVQELKFEKDREGRLAVDSSLSFNKNAFAIGDAACFKHKERPLRMAVQFSIAEARIAALNIVRLINNESKLLTYKPLDLGFLVPMANRKACGKVFLFKIWGIAGWVLHYVICIYRSLNFRSRWGLACDAFYPVSRRQG